MKYISLILFSALLIILPYNAHAKSKINKCFENETTNGSISFCLTLANEDLNAIRNIIEDEMVEMVNSDRYFPPPQYKEINHYTGISIKESGLADKAILKAQENQRTLHRNKHLLEKKKYEVKKNEFLNKLYESRQFFDHYKEIECSVRKERFADDENSFLQSFEYKICLHDMTNQRIENLQKLM